MVLAETHSRLQITLLFFWIPLSWGGGRVQGKLGKTGSGAVIPGELCSKSGCLLWAKILASKREGRKHPGHSRTPGSLLHVCVRDAVDVLSLQLKKEKKTPKRVFVSS